MTFFIFVSNSLALWIVWSRLLYKVCAFLELTCAYMEKKTHYEWVRVQGKMNWKSPPKEEEVKVIGSVHHLFLQGFEFTVQIAQFFLQAVHFGALTWDGRAEVEQLALEVDTKLDSSPEQTLPSELRFLQHSQCWLYWGGVGAGTFWNNLQDESTSCWNYNKVMK